MVKVLKHQAAVNRLSEVFSALSDPTRRQMLTILSRGETTVNKLAAPFAMSLPAVSKHLKVLEKAGLVERSIEAQWRPCRIQAAPLKEVNDWISDYRRFWEESSDRLDSYLQKLQNKEIKTTKEKVTTKPKHTLKRKK